MIYLVRLRHAGKLQHIMNLLDPKAGVRSIPYSYATFIKTDLDEKQMKAGLLDSADSIHCIEGDFCIAFNTISD